MVRVAAPASFNFADVWEMAADALGDRPALVVGDQRRTYADLEARANRLAHHLVSKGVEPGQHVGLYLENCPEYLEAMVACFKIRAVPIKSPKSLCGSKSVAVSPTSTKGSGEASGEEYEIDSATPSVTTDQLVVVSSRVRQIVLR